MKPYWLLMEEEYLSSFLFDLIWYMVGANLREVKLACDRNERHPEVTMSHGLLKVAPTWDFKIRLIAGVLTIIMVICCDA